ncbi:ABC transporter permease [Nocardioides sp. Kera G14]|uniref:ABC transporter permease n=1 Tax=Nocardioides sp. Kera G14 TaxID=2884264 RepID=UPI001D126315|nr:hypothetical protein [Nocardioides sp. Kera G14]UDY25130.1 hypothetical protein LH076_07520 [Nocardioides sp. Kera G14]
MRTTAYAGPFTGTALLLRQNLRRDRIIAPVWIAVMVVMTYASAASTTTLFKTTADRLRLATSINEQPALRALYGPILDPGSVGELAMSKMTELYALFAAVLFVILVRRHTRVEEESGRSELIGATVVGRDAPMAAVLVECAGLAAVLGLAVGGSAIAGGLPVSGSVWFGLTWAGTALVGTAVAAVAVQLSASARTCGGFIAGMLGGIFLLRALGDGGRWTWLSWLSPLGWNTQLRAWSDPRGWAVLLYPAITAVLLVLARELRAHRDLGGGLIAARPGRVVGPAWVRSPIALILRLQRTSLILWTVAIAFMGVAFGAMAPGLDDMVESVGSGQELIDRLGGVMIAAVLSIGAMIITCFAVTVINHSSADETDGRLEMVLSTGASRRGWYAGTVVVAFAGAGWLVFVLGLGLWLGYGLAGGNDPYAALGASLAWIPAVTLVAAFGLLAWSFRPSWSIVGWFALVLFLLLTVVGELLELPEWVIDLSPYSAVPQYPAEAWRWMPLIVLAVLATLATVGAWFRFRERDIG